MTVISNDSVFHYIQNLFIDNLFYIRRQSRKLISIKINSGQPLIAERQAIVVYGFAVTNPSGVGLVSLT